MTDERSGEGFQWEWERKLKERDATIAAQAAEIERLKEQIASKARIVEIQQQESDGDLTTIGQLLSENAALRSQLEEQRKRLDGAVMFEISGFSFCKEKEGGWTIFCESKQAYVTEYELKTGSKIKSRFESCGKAVEFCVSKGWITREVAANWLTPHAEKDGG